MGKELNEGGDKIKKGRDLDRGRLSVLLALSGKRDGRERAFLVIFQR